MQAGICDKTFSKNLFIRMGGGGSCRLDALLAHWGSPGKPLQSGRRGEEEEEKKREERRENRIEDGEEKKNREAGRAKRGEVGRPIRAAFRPTKARGRELKKKTKGAKSAWAAILVLEIGNGGDRM